LLLDILSVGQLGLLMGKFNMCVDASQSTLWHSLIDGFEKNAFEFFSWGS
jgi:hypothetical protein